MLDKILVALDGSVLSDEILTQVGRLLVRRDAEVRLVTVVPPSGHLLGKPMPPERGALEQAGHHLVQLARSLNERGARAGSLVLMGDPTVSILEQVREWQPDLIAMATHGRSGLSRLIQGSVAETLLRYTKCPLLVANPKGLAMPGPIRFRRILVPLDGSDRSLAVLATTTELARLHGSEVILLCATSLPAGSIEDPTVEAADVRREALAFLDRSREALPGVAVRILTEMGDPAATILAVAEREDVDLVAMATHGRTGLSRFAYGSVTDHVLRECGRPLLVQRSVALADEADAPRVEQVTPSDRKVTAP
jgi:nucleotide-binding universal stress UspA family protein